MRKTTSANEMTSTPRLWITGMGSQYPAHLLTPDDFDAFAARFYDVKNLGYEKPEIQSTLPALKKMQHSKTAEDQSRDGHQDSHFSLYLRCWICQ